MDIIKSCKHRKSRFLLDSWLLAICQQTPAAAALSDRHHSALEILSWHSSHCHLPPSLCVPCSKQIQYSATNFKPHSTALPYMAFRNTILFSNIYPHGKQRHLCKVSSVFSSTSYSLFVFPSPTARLLVGELPCSAALMQHPLQNPRGRKSKCLWLTLPISRLAPWVGSILPHAG